MRIRLIVFAIAVLLGLGGIFLFWKYGSASWGSPVPDLAVNESLASAPVSDGIKKPASPDSGAISSGPDTVMNPGGVLERSEDSAINSTTGKRAVQAGVGNAASSAQTVAGGVSDPASGRPGGSSSGSSQPTIAAILQGTDLSDPGARALAVARIAELQEARLESAHEKADRLGIPIRIEGPGHKVSILYDFRGDEPLYRTTMNSNAAISTGANQLRDLGAPYGLDGTGMKAAVWDEAKVRNTHQEFPNNRVSIKDSASTFSEHATHVAGTIGANGTIANAKGMAPKALIDSYDWDSDYSEMTAAGAATATEAGKLGLSNHSYGYDAATADMGRYEEEANTTDALAFSLPFYQIFWAAGNEQDVLTAKGGYQSITFNGLSKNVVTVGAGDDAVAGGLRSPSAGTLAYFSSMGPCDDGRIKPDITANGVSLYSCVSNSNTSYDGTYSGTSMATPNAVGSALLVQQLYAREFSGQRLRASMLKALLIQTADDVGRPGPDYQYGWGYLNVKAAADLILAHKASLASPKLIQGTITNAAKTLSHTFTWDGTSPIRATLCWTDPAGAAQTAADSRTPNLVHDLNLKITAPDGTTTSFPYVMPFVGTWSTGSMTQNATTGVNRVDNVEQVHMPAPTQAGAYTMTVSLNGTLTTASQVYSLIVTGGLGVETNPPPVVTLDSPANGTVILPGSTVTLNATATDKTIGGGNGTVANVEFFSGNASLGTDAGAPYSMEWTPPAPGAYVLSARATDTEGAAATSASLVLTVLSGDGTPSISSFAPASGVSGDTVTISGTNFANVSSVKFNGVDAQFAVTSPTSLTATVPATATSGVLSVTTPYGTATSPTSFAITQNPVLISQIYGAGGTSGAVLNADFVELHNRGATTVSLSGWSLQYASASGTAWQAAELSGSIAPGKYYLVKLAGGSSGAALPAPDATGTLNLSGSSGKVALRNSTSLFTGSSPSSQSGLQDFVGFGAANAYEGSGAAASPSSTTAIFRAGGGATDAGNNASDFSVAAPNPRNSSSGTTSAPVISSAATASGVVGQAFTYQITASNSPASFAASSLPQGLSVNTSTGLISGTPTTAGTANATISATNSAGTGNATLTITVVTGGGGSVTVFAEDMGSPSGTTSIASNLFQNANLTFSGTADVRITTPSTGYTSSSGTGNVFITNSVGTFFEISGINTLGYSSLALTLGHHKSTTAGNNELIVETSVDGTTYTALSYSRPTGSGTTTWLRVAPTGTIPSTANLRIRFRQTSSNTQFRIDDVVLSGLSAATPIISTAGTLAAVNTTYGTASASPATFTVSGANMLAGILVTAPAGFEVSQTPGGGSGYAVTQTVGGAGTISVTNMFLRLAANTAADSYAGNVICSSTGAATANIPVATSVVNRKTLVVTAHDRTRVFGSPFELGTSAFDSAGLVPGETIGSVTLTTSGGTALYDPIGTYEISASHATGGTFSPGNYDISYQPGTLTVSGQDFSAWMSGRQSGADAHPDADPEGDGIPNRLEYFMGLDPTAGDAAGLPTIDLDGGALHFDYRRSKALSGTVGIVEWTSDLTGSPTWSTTGISDSPLSDEGPYEMRRATINLLPSESKKFLRLRVLSE